MCLIRSASCWFGSVDDDQELARRQAKAHSMPDRDRLAVKVGQGAVLGYQRFGGEDATDISQAIGAVGVKSDLDRPAIPLSYANRAPRAARSSRSTDR